jgi:hypothetical protein
MSGRDKAFGGTMVVIALLLAVIYFWALFGGFALWAMEIVVSIFTIVILMMVGWVGYTIATTPSIEEIEAAARKK